MNEFKLDNHPKIASGYTTPTDYFENLPANVLKKVAEKQPKQGTIFTLKPFVYAAAAIVVLALCLPFFLNSATASEEQIDTQTLENYLAYQSGVSTYDLINLMEVSELDAMEVDLLLEDKSVEDILISNPNFENYLID